MQAYVDVCIKGFSFCSRAVCAVLVLGCGGHLVLSRDSPIAILFVAEQI